MYYRSAYIPDSNDGLKRAKSLPQRGKIASFSDTGHQQTDDGTTNEAVDQ